MRVALDVTPAVHGRAGIGRYAGELARALAPLMGEDELTLFYVDRAGREPAPPLDRLPRRVLRRRERLWRAQVLFAVRAGLAMDRTLGGPDVFHAADHLLPPLARARAVFTLYDLTFLDHPETQTRLHHAFLAAGMPRFLRAARRVIAISESTRARAVAAFGLPPERVSVIFPGVSGSYRPAGPEAVAGLRARLGLPERYVLHLGTVEPRKNLPTLIAALGRARPEGVKLVLAGRTGWRAGETLRALAESGWEENVIRVGLVPESDLPALYSGAELFAYPSLYEGFGLPVLEAMACGTAVVTSDRTSLPEVVGDAGVLVPALDVDAWAEALRAMLADGGRRAELAERGRARAGRFTWAAAARATLAVYREAHADRP